MTLLSSALAAAGLSAPAATSQPQPSPSGQAQPPPREEPSVRPADPRGPCAGRSEVHVRGRLHGCTHGPDPRPAGVDVSRDPIRNPRDGLTSPSTPGASDSGTTTAAAGNSIACVGDGASGPRVQALYVYGPGGGDQSASVIPSIKSWVSDIDAVFNTSAAATGAARRVRWVHDASCQVVVYSVAVSASELDDFGDMIDAVERQGFNRSDRKYMVWADTNAAGICGIGELYLDDQPGAGNLNNRGDMFARVDRPCWGLANSTEAHELMHAIGGVQLSAPHATSLNHCTDNWDRMCYADGGATTTTVCATSALENQFDCNHDDYYYAGTPPTGSYLRTHWNTANSVYLDPGLPVVLGANPTSLAAGTATNVSWANVAAPTAFDWIGLYSSPSAADGGFLTWRYAHPPGASGSASFTIPATTPAGSGYQLRLYANNGYTRLAVSSPITVLAGTLATVTANPTSVAAGSSTSVSWSGVTTPTPKDWFGLFANANAPDTAYLAWDYTTGAASGTKSLAVPSSTPLGTTYQIRLFSNDGFSALGASGPITVQAPPPPTLSANPTTVIAGNSATVSWSGIVTPTKTDWVGLYASDGAADTAFLAWAYAGGGANGSLALRIPTSLPAGATYEFRLFANNGYTRLGAPAPITVQAAPPLGVSASPTTVARGGTAAVSWSGIPNPAPKDWVGLYPTSTTPDTAFVAWMYTNGEGNDQMSFLVPASVTPGTTYQFRLYANNGYTLLAVSAPFTVT